MDLDSGDLDFSNDTVDPDIRIEEENQNKNSAAPEIDESASSHSGGRYRFFWGNAGSVGKQNGLGS